MGKIMDFLKAVFTPPPPKKKPGRPRKSTKKSK